MQPLMLVVALVLLVSSCADRADLPPPPPAADRVPQLTLMAEPDAVVANARLRISLAIENRSRREYAIGGAARLDHWTGTEWEPLYGIGPQRRDDPAGTYWRLPGEVPVAGVEHPVPSRATTDVGIAWLPPLPRGYYRITQAVGEPFSRARDDVELVAHLDVGIPESADQTS